MSLIATTRIPSARSATTRTRGATLLGAAVLSMLAACGDSTVAPGGELELVSRVTLTLTPVGGGTPLTTFIDDPDGNGPQAPSAQVGTLSLLRGVTYTGSVAFENRLRTPIEDITAEVRAEANEHRVFFTASSNGVTVTTTDVDPQNRPLGTLFSQAVSGSATVGAGTLRVVLCHYDNVPKLASFTSCTAETDIDLTFGFNVANPA